MHLKGVRLGLPLVRKFGLLKHNGTYQVSWNRHPGIEIHYVLKGSIAWELQDSADVLAVPGGYFGIVPANARHRAVGNVGTPSVRLGMILERPKPSLVDGTPFSEDDLMRIFRRFKENGGRVRRFSARLSELLHAFAETLSPDNAQNPDGQLKLRMISSMLLYETYATLGEPEALAEGHDVIPKIRKWIGLHFAERITAPRLVKLSGYGRSRFFSLFLAKTGMSPNDYLTRVRIENAKRRLARREPDGSMLDLAVSCGFNSASAFSATFRKHVGVSPRTFKAAALGGRAAGES